MKYKLNIYNCINKLTVFKYIYIYIYLYLNIYTYIKLLFFQL